MVGVGFDKYLLATGEHWFSGPGKRINDAARRNYATLRWIHLGQSEKATVKKAGGTSFKDQTMLTITPRMLWKDISTYTTPGITETGVNHSFHWRLAETHIAWDDWIDEHNAHANVTSGGGAQQFKDYAEQKFQEMETDSMNFQEDSYWAQPDYAGMETGGTAGLPAYSLLCKNNEFSQGIIPASTGSTLWAQFQGIASTEPGASTNYIPRRDGYANLTVNDPNNLINAFDTQYEFLRIEPPPTKQEYFEMESGMDSPACATFTQVAGLTRLKQLCRASNDKWQDPTDAYFGRPTFAGIPLVCPTALEAGLLYPTGTSGAWGAYSTTTNSNAGPRYHTFNFKYMKTVYDADWYMRPKPLGTEWGRATRNAIMYYMGWNNFNISPRRHGTIYPTANIA